MAKRIRTHTGSYHPWDAAVLAVDTATTSGWAVRIRGRLTASGQCDTRRTSAVDAAVELARDHAARAGAPFVVCLERPFGGSVTVVMALGQARERWLRAAGSGARVCDVTPSTWRSELFGSKWVRAPRDEVRAYELRTACAESGMSPADIGDDEAAAICISAWAARARVLGVKFGLTPRKAPA